MSFFFFFKQKTAYEMRISDWSSDVCSSDLRRLGPGHVRQDRGARPEHAIGIRGGAQMLGPEVALEADDVPALGRYELGRGRLEGGDGAPADERSLRSDLVRSRTADSRVGEECVRTCTLMWQT